MNYIRGIDVSHWQGKIDWNKVVKDNVEFAFVKVGGSDDGFYTDPFFQTNIKAAYDNGVKCGVYYYVGPKCVRAIDGEADAKRFIDIITPFKKYISLPVVMDFEAPGTNTKNGNTDAVISFCSEIKKAGFIPMVYASEISGFTDRIYSDKINDIYKWVAKWSPVAPSIKWDVWQYSATGIVSGILGDVDMDYITLEFWDNLFNKTDNKAKAIISRIRGELEELERML